MVDKTRPSFFQDTDYTQKQLSNRVPIRMIVFANENRFFKKSKIVSWRLMEQNYKTTSRKMKF